MMPVKELARNLEEARVRAGLSRTQVAARLGVTERTIYRYERAPGKRGVSPSVLRMLAELYDAPELAA